MLGVAIASGDASATASPYRKPVRGAQVVEGLGLGLAGAMSLGLGTGLLLQHRRGYAHFEAAPNNAGFVTALTASEAGFGLLGAGFGLGVTAVSARLKLGERGMWAELVVGGAVALIGTAWYAREAPQVQRDLYEGGVRPGHDVGALRREAAAAGLLGAGVGMVAGAGVLLLLRRLLRGFRGRRTAAHWGMVGNRDGLGLGGRF